jgi:hypothetical protein
LAVSVGFGTYSAVHGSAVARENKKAQTKALKETQREFDIKQTFFEQAALSSQRSAIALRAAEAQAAGGNAPDNQPVILAVFAFAAVGLAVWFFFRK